MPADFVHLHVHTEYSLLDGANRVGDLVKKAKSFGLPALAMTDHGAMYGTVEFYKAAEKAGVKPILGCEVYVAPGSRFERRPSGDGETSYHLILLARNEEGYRNLCRLVTRGYTEGFYYKPRIDKELLREFGSGLIGLSACLGGEVPRAVLSGNLEKARALAAEYAGILGEGNYYFELMENGIPEQAQLNEGLLELGKSMGIPVVATNDCHYLERADAKSHEVLVCIQTGKTLHDEKRMKMSTDAFYVKSPEEMAAAFHYAPEAIRATVEIAERCNVQLDFKTYHFPQYQLDREETLADCLDRLAREGLEERLDARQYANAGEEAEVRTRYRERLEIELKVIRDMQFPGYFLIVQDFINWSKDNGVPVGPGRGSAAGSLAAYALRITNIDPIPYDLLFERFLNPERVSLPDIDVDFCFENRERAIQYVTEKYGEDKVGQITTFGKMLARAVIRDVGRVLGIPYGEVDRIAKLIPSRLGITLQEALEEEPRLKEAMEQDARIAELLEHALKLEGLNRHASTHAAGVVIANRPLVDYLPLYKGQNGETVTQFAMKSVESIGLIKFDFLGLKTLTVVEDAVRIINQRAAQNGSGEKLDIDLLPMDDPAVYELLSKGATTGVFQLESEGMKELMVKLRPSVFEDIIALVALYRPGPLGSGMVEDFIRRKHGEIPVEYDLPQLAPILKDTYGVIVYQEQVMKIAQVLADYTLGEADLLRRAMGKKNAEEMAAQRARFQDGAKKKGIDPAKAEAIFDLMAKFAEYGFNKSHSAAYALISYQTAWLKAHHPVEFMAALLTNDRANTDKVVKDIGECREMGIPVLPPDVNESDLHFTAVGNAIRFGLAAVKNVGEAALESVLAGRASTGPFRGLLDFCERVDLQKVNRKVVESLIQCGAFDSLGGTRAQYLAYVDRALDRGNAAQKDRARGQTNLFDLLAPSGGNGNGPADPSADELPAVPPLPPSQQLQSEKEVLGMYLSGHPLVEWDDLLKTYTDGRLSDLLEKPDKSTVTVGGTVAAIKAITTKTGNRMAFVTLEDVEGTVEVVVFSDVYAKSANLLSSDQPLLVRGTLEKSEDSGKILAEEIHPLSEAQERLAKAVHIHVNGALHTRDDLGTLRALLEKPDHRGPCQAYVHILLPERAETVIRLPESFGLRATAALKSEVHRLIGNEHCVQFR